MLIGFIVIVSIFSLWLAIIWGVSTPQNTLVKVLFYIISFWGAYLLFSLLPQVVLPNGMRVL